MVPWPSPRPLPMLSRLGTTNSRRTNRRHNLVLPKNRRTPRAYPQRRRNPSCSRTYPRLTTTPFSRTTRPIPQRPPNVTARTQQNLPHPRSRGGKHCSGGGHHYPQTDATSTSAHTSAQPCHNSSSTPQLLQTLLVTLISASL